MQQEDDVPSCSTTATSTSQWPFCIKPAAGKGLGAFATRDIALGERVLAEPPLFCLDCQTGSGAQAAAEAAAEAALAALPPAARQAVAELHQSPVHGEGRTALRTFLSNSLPLGASGTAQSAGLFLQAARFNHSCVPNVRHQWNAALGQQTIHACAAVAAGEELLTSYIDLEQPREPRQRALRQRFGFDCTCAACAPPAGGETAAVASDARRAELQQLLGGVFAAVYARRYARAVELAERQLALLHAEGLDSPGLLERAEFDAFQALRHAGEHAAARERLVRVRKHCALAMGEDAPGVQLYSRMLVDLGPAEGEGGEDAPSDTAAT